MRQPSDAILADLVRSRAERIPDLDVLSFEHWSLDGGATPDEVRTCADLVTNANRIAAGLVARGMARGDRFALMMRNHPEFVETMVAASVSGGVFVPIDPRTKGAKLAYTLGHSQCRGLVCADHALAQVAADYRPNALTGYLYELATRFNIFYQTLPVLKAPAEKRPTRLLLCELASRLLRTGLDLLGIETLEAM